MGLKVIEERADARPTYRDSAAPANAVGLEQAEAFVGAWDQLRVWQEGAGTLRFEGSFHRWRNHLLVAWVVFALAYGGVITFCCPSWWGWAMGSWLFLWFLPMHARHKRRTRLWMQSLVEEELRAAVAPARAEPAPSTAAPASASAAGAGVDPRVRVDDPALALAARTSRAARSEPPDRSPEDEVAALERDATRRGR
jgi:hypothetical protein